MKVFVSSTYIDLREHRAAAIAVLRQLGHEVLAMEDLVAGAEPPLTKVIDLVDQADAYVGVFAWRYGQVIPQNPPVSVKGAQGGTTSITHSEYLRAKERAIPTLAFLLEERAPWSPALIDGLDGAADTDASWNIRALRRELLQEKVVSFFTTPESLAARVAPAVTVLGLSRQIDIQPAAHVPAGGTGAIDGSHREVILRTIAEAKLDQPVLRIDLHDTWWHTRLFLLAALAERLTHVRRILIVDSAATRSRDALGRRSAFVGLVSTSSVLGVLGPMLPLFETFMSGRSQVEPMSPDPRKAAEELLDAWSKAFTPQPQRGRGRTTTSETPSNTGEANHEQSVAITLTSDLLQRWLGELMISQAVEIQDLQRVSVGDLLRLVDYPGAFVPILKDRDPEDPPGVGIPEVLEKAALNARLAHSYLTELRQRDRIF